MEVLKVSSKSNPNSVAGALAGVLREKGSAEIQAIGEEMCIRDRVMSDFVNYKNNLGHITFKINEPYTCLLYTSK